MADRVLRKVSVGLVAAGVTSAALLGTGSAWAEPSNSSDGDAGASESSTSETAHGDTERATKTVDTEPYS